VFGHGHVRGDHERSQERDGEVQEKIGRAGPV
jgi:hypothetical protein